MDTTQSAWRTGIDPDDLREYDAFGPWIDEVTGERDLPRRFRLHRHLLRDADFVLKVPRDIDRAEIRPGDDLYHTVVAAFPDRLVILRAEPEHIAHRIIDFREVVAVRAFTEMLLGRWSLLLADGSTVELAYNGASADQLARLNDLTVLQLTPTAPAAQSTPFLSAIGLTTDHYFRNRFDEAQRRLGPLAPLYFDASSRPCRTDTGRLRKTGGLLLAGNDDLLVAIDRGQADQPLFLPIHGSGMTVVSWRRLTGFALLQPRRRAGLHRLRLELGQASIDLRCLQPPDAVMGSLLGRDVPERSIEA